ncbi:hypothetical protein Tco_1462917 [Tanacetum coccineum]
MYSDVNVELKDTELEGEGNYDKKMTDDVHVDAEQDNVNQEDASDQVKDIHQAIVTVAPATQKTEVLLQISSMSSNYATKFLNFDNIPLAETKIISMIDIKVQHEDPSSQTSPHLTVLVTSRQSEMSDHSLAIRAAIKSKVPTVVKEYLGTSLDDTLHKQQKPQKSAANIHKIMTKQAGKQQETKYTITSSDTTEIQEFNQKRTLFKTMTKTKSFNKNTKHKALYHALMESILEDEDGMDKGVADRLKKRKPKDADRDECPLAG